MTLLYSGTLTFGACALEVDWSTMDFGGGDEDDSFFLEWILDALQNTITYEYDRLNRLKGVSYEDGPSYGYEYDAVGNRLSQDVCVPGEACVETDYVYDDLNRLTSVNGQSYSWDNNGNLLSDGFNTYTYDYANRLVAVRNPQLEILSRYNGDGLRIGATINEVVVDYTYDVNISLPVLLAETQDESIIYSYYGLGMAAQRTQDAWSYPLHDALGSTRQLVDEELNLAASYQYDPFGVLSSKSSWETGAATSFRFAGEQQDPSNLYYLRARYYDPLTGRFTQIDPFPGLLTLPDTINPYLYTLNNPVNFVDPSGEFIAELLIIMAIGFGAGAIAGELYYLSEVLAGNLCFNWPFAIMYPLFGGMLGSIIAPLLFGGYMAGAAMGWWGGTASAVSSFPELARRLGRVGEVGANIIKNTSHIRSLSNTAPYRIPDQLLSKAKLISEVKNVASLSYTKQIKDYVLYAQKNGLQFELWVRANTKLSASLKAAINQGLIILRYLP